MPLSFQLYQPDGGALAAWKLTESSTELRQSIDLSPADALQYEHFRVEKRRCEWLASRLLVKHLTGTVPDIRYQPNGKPLLNNYHISISHTHEIAVVAIHPNHAVTIDVEMITDRVTKVADRFLHPQEWAMIPKQNALLWQTLIWCAKEALFKYWDEQEIDFKEHLRILPFVPTPNQPFIIETLFTKNDIKKELTLIGQYTQTWAMVYLL